MRAGAGRMAGHDSLLCPCDSPGRPLLAD